MNYKGEQIYVRNILSVHADSGAIRCITLRLEALPDILDPQIAESLLDILKPTLQAYLDMRCRALDILEAK